jgi:hypothetical protein
MRFDSPEETKMGILSRRIRHLPHRPLLHWLFGALLLVLVFAALAGCASMEGSTKQRQVASMLGFLYPGKEQGAVQQMIDGLHREVQAFRVRAPKDPTIQLILPPGYRPGAAPVAPRPAGG